jgi:RNA polymerase sigma factor (sigma-70 family)
MNTDEIVTMCEKLARKYKRSDMTDDLVSEGVLAVYERLEVKPDEYPASLYRRANKAMHDHINIKNKPVNIPRTRTAESVSKGVSYTSGSYSQRGKKNLEAALNSVSVSSDEDYTLSTPDCAEKYEIADFLSKALGSLSAKERSVINCIYFLELSRVEVGKLKGVSQQAISEWEREALNKMSRL